MVTSNAHTRPPEALKNVYKTYQKMAPSLLNHDLGVLDFSRGLTQEQSQRVKATTVLSQVRIQSICSQFQDIEIADFPMNADVPVYHCEGFSGSSICLLVRPCVLI